MRIVGGEWGGRKLVSPGARVRPTQDRVRQILFDILGGSVGGGPVLDLYAGSGALGLEALSRGAPHAVLVEANAKTAAVLRRNCEIAGERARVLAMPVRRALALLEREEIRFRWILADPPYGHEDVAGLLERLGSSGLLEAGDGLVLESRAQDRIPDQAGGLREVRLRVVGETALHFYRRSAGAGGDARQAEGGETGGETPAGPLPDRGEEDA